MAGRLVFGLVLATLVLAPLAGAEEEDIESIDACMRANLPERTSKQSVELKSTDRTGGSRTLEADIHMRRGDNKLAQTLIEVEAPPADRGSRYLWLEQEDRNDTWVCLPELQRVRRVHPSSGDGALFGTDFSYEDVQHMQRISKDSTAKRLPDDTLDGRAVYRVHADTTGQEKSTYDHILYAIDQQSCLPLRIEFFDTPDHRRKLMTTDPASIEKRGEGWVARSVRMEDEAQGTHSELDVEKIELDVEIPKRMFTLSYLERRCR